MNDVLFDYLNVFYIAYLDDILIYSEDPLEYETYVRKVLKRLYKARRRGLRYSYSYYYVID